MLNKNKKIIIAAVVFVVIVVGVVVLLFAFKKSDSGQNIENAPEEKINLTEEKKEENSDQKQEDLPQKTPVQNEGENPNNFENLTGVITSSRNDGENFIIRTSIDQYLSSGSCVLKMNSREKNFSSETKIIPLVSTSTCDGFDIPIKSLGSGKWNIKIEIISENKKGIIEKEVEI